MRTLRDRTRYLLRQLLALRRLRQTHGLRTRRGEEWGDRRDRAQVAFDVSSRRGAGRRARAPHHCQWLGVCRFGHVASLRLCGGPFIHHDLLCADCWHVLAYVLLLGSTPKHTRATADGGRGARGGTRGRRTPTVISVRVCATRTARRHEVKALTIVRLRDALWYCETASTLYVLRLYFFYMIFLLASLRPARHRASRRRGQLACSRPDLRDQQASRVQSCFFSSASTVYLPPPIFCSSSSPPAVAMLVTKCSR